MDEHLDADDLRLVVDRAKGQDPDAWEQLYRHSHARLLVFARRRTSTPRAAEDAVSEAFMRAIERVDAFTWRGAGFDAWMYGITRNVILEQHRDTGRDRRLEERQAGSLPVHADAHVGEALESAEEHALVRRAFDLLDDADRELLELRVVGGLTADEVGSVLGKNAGAIRMAQSRALDRLRAAMTEPGMKEPGMKEPGMKERGDA